MRGAFLGFESAEQVHHAKYYNICYILKRWSSNTMNLRTLWSLPESWHFLKTTPNTGFSPRIRRLVKLDYPLSSFIRFKVPFIEANKSKVTFKPIEAKLEWRPLRQVWNSLKQKSSSKFQVQRPQNVVFKCISRWMNQMYGTFLYLKILIRIRPSPTFWTHQQE